MAKNDKGKKKKGLFSGRGKDNKPVSRRGGSAAGRPKRTVASGTPPQAAPPRQQAILPGPVPRQQAEQASVPQPRQQYPRQGNPQQLLPQQGVPRQVPPAQQAQQKMPMQQGAGAQLSRQQAPPAQQSAPAQPPANAQSSANVQPPAGPQRPMQQQVWNVALKNGKGQPASGAAQPPQNEAATQREAAPPQQVAAGAEAPLFAEGEMLEEQPPASPPPQPAGQEKKDKHRKPAGKGLFRRRVKEKQTVASRQPVAPPESDASVWEIAQGTEAQQQQELEQERERERANRKKRRRRRFVKRAVACCAVLLVLLVATSIIFLENATKNDDLWLDLAQIPYKGESILYYTDPQSGEVGEYTRLQATQNKEYVDGSQMPQQLKDAFVAVEDKKFYDHSGVDVPRTLYAMLNEVKRAVTGSYIGGEEGFRQGASTIDQQLIKNLTRDDEYSDMAGYLRKAREIYRAFKLDAKYSKDEILVAYLNTISFTGNTAGVQAEARKHFGKTVDQLTLAECASLAAITRNPGQYNPATKPEAHLERRNYVLGLMLEQGYINQQQHDEAVAQPLQVTGNRDPVRQQVVTSYFTDQVMDDVVQQLMDQRGLTKQEANYLLYNGGLRIYTTVHHQLQNSMEQVMQNNSSWAYPYISRTAPKQQFDEAGNPILDASGNPVYQNERVTPQAAMISLDYNGGICAVVGGLGEKEVSRGFNRGTAAVRQVGSTMKTISPYVLGIEERKITWSSAFMDSPVKKEKDEETGQEKDWPTNVDNVYTNRDILVKDAFARSVNTIAVRVGQQVGELNMYNFVANKLEIGSFVWQDRDLGPLVLGSSTYGITPADMAKSYAMFGNGGTLPTVHSFTKIENGAGTLMLETPLNNKDLIGEDTAYIMNRLMAQVMQGNGTASGMRVPGNMDSVGKTGTTSDNRDHWFIGLTPYYVTASWYGYDENVPLYISSRSHPPTLAWRNVMRQGQQSLPDKGFPEASGVEQHEYCTQSGYAAGPNCPRATGYYTADNPPKQGCPVHGG